MKKIINAREVTEIEIKFADGTSLDIVFDVEAVSNFTELDGGLTAFIKEDKLPERCAKVVYIGAKARKPEFTIEDARMLVSNLHPETITVIMSEFNEGMSMAQNGVQSDLVKKLMEQLIQTTK